jgi:hypothetical protein
MCGCVGLCQEKVALRERRESERERARARTCSRVWAGSILKTIDAFLDDCGTLWWMDSLNLRANFDMASVCSHILDHTPDILDTCMYPPPHMTYLITYLTY